jgi:hypothetical protein
MKIEFIYQKMSRRDYETFITMLSQMFAEYLQEIKQKEVQNGSGSKTKNREAEKVPQEN